MSTGNITHQDSNETNYAHNQLNELFFESNAELGIFKSFLEKNSRIQLIVDGMSNEYSLRSISEGFIELHLSSSISKGEMLSLSVSLDKKLHSFFPEEERDIRFLLSLKTTLIKGIIANIIDRSESTGNENDRYRDLLKALSDVDIPFSEKKSLLKSKHQGIIKSYSDDIAAIRGSIEKMILRHMGRYVARTVNILTQQQLDDKKSAIEADGWKPSADFIPGEFEYYKGQIEGDHIIFPAYRDLLPESTLRLYDILNIAEKKTRIQNAIKLNNQNMVIEIQLELVKELTTYMKTFYYQNGLGYTDGATLNGILNHDKNGLNCFGYNYLAQLFLLECGIPCESLGLKTENNYHYAISLEIGGKFYFYDPLWFDEHIEYDRDTTLLSVLPNKEIFFLDGIFRGAFVVFGDHEDIPLSNLYNDIGQFLRSDATLRDAAWKRVNLYGATYPTRNTAYSYLDIGDYVSAIKQIRRNIILYPLDEVNYLLMSIILKDVFGMIPLVRVYFYISQLHMKADISEYKDLFKVIYDSYMHASSYLDYCLLIQKILYIPPTASYEEIIAILGEHDTKRGTTEKRLP